MIKSSGLAGRFGFSLFAAWVASLALIAQDREPPRLQPLVGAALEKPGYLPFDRRFLAALHLRSGFRINVFAAPGGNARMMAVHRSGVVYLTRQQQGDVLRLRDTDGDGRADVTSVAATGLPLVHGIEIDEDTVYLVAPTTVWRATIAADGTIAAPTVIISDLPDGGQHRARSIRIGSDRQLYIGVGSTCNACDETNPENATLLQANLDGSGRRIYARGLRHTVGFDWHPVTGELWGMDMGTDWRGNDLPPEELNLITDGGNYGWPFCFAARRVDRWLNAPPPPGVSRREYCAATVPPALTYRAHSSPIALRFYTGTQFPAEYRDDAFVTMRGSWNRTPPSGYKVVRVRFEGGKPTAIEDFVTGFRIDPSRHFSKGERRGESYQFARVAGLVVAADGSLLFSDDSNGIIYRVAAHRPGVK